MISLNMKDVGKHGVLIGFCLVVYSAGQKYRWDIFFTRMLCWVLRTWPHLRWQEKVLGSILGAYERRKTSNEDLKKSETFSNKARATFDPAFYFVSRGLSTLWTRQVRSTCQPLASLSRDSVASFLAPCCFTETLTLGRMRCLSRNLAKAEVGRQPLNKLPTFFRKN